MKKIKLLLIVTLFSQLTMADEGMWLPMFLEKLNYEDMKSKGLQLTADQIYSVNNSSLKDAIVRMGGGFCTGELISPEGLMLTNHHCAYDFIQQHSTVENDLLTDGFWAKSKSEELPNEGLYVEFLVRMKDVTSEVLQNVNGQMAEDERMEMVQKEIDNIIQREKGFTNYNVVVNSFFEGNAYYLFVYETYYDVRLVGAPPESIGKFGGETDNWMWPRHTGDFSLFRIYTGPDGKPAPYSAENIPLKPKHYLPISLDGIREGDFAMIFGFPGSTERYLTSYGIDLAVNESNPTRIEIRDRKLKIMKEDMDADPEIRLKYASKYAVVSNYWKYFIGQNKGLKNLNVYEKKLRQEDRFKKWISEDAARNAAYKNTFDLLDQGYKEFQKYNIPQIYAYEAGFGAELPLFGYKFTKLKKMLEDENTDPNALAKFTKIIQFSAEEYFRDYNPATDKKIFSDMMEMFYRNVNRDFYPSFFQAVECADTPDSLKIYPGYECEKRGDFNSLADFIYSHSILTDQDRLTKFLEDPTYEVLANDPGFKTSESLIEMYRNTMMAGAESQDDIQSGNRLYIKGLQEMYPDKKFYPDANSTLRFTYGKVESYMVKDGIKYDYYTTLKGVMEKEDPANPEFIVHPKLKELYDKHDFGPYGPDGKLVVGFLTNTDITGGNSGSPVINARGELIGTAFDGNWEAMSGDIAFEPELQRTISLDIRYTLFIIDKFAGATNLIDEMTLVKNSDKGGSKRKSKKGK